MKKTLEIISIVLVFVGLTVSFLELKRWLPNPRLELANRIMNLGENVLPFDTPYIDELILSFLPAKYPRLSKNNLQSALRELEGVVIENIIIDGHDVFGSVRIQHKDGKRAEIICGFQDLKEWASKKRYVKWVGWVLAFLGAGIHLSLFVIRKRNEMNES